MALTKLDLGNLGVHVVNKGLHPGGIFLFVCFVLLLLMINARVLVHMSL